jgi:hypothetical protein
MAIEQPNTSKRPEETQFSATPQQEYTISGRQDSTLKNYLQAFARNASAGAQTMRPGMGRNFLFALSSGADLKEKLKNIEADKIQTYFDDNDKETLGAATLVSRKYGKMFGDDARKSYFEGQASDINPDAALRTLGGSDPDGLEYLNLVVVDGNPFADINMGQGKFARVPIDNNKFLALGKLRETARLDQIQQARKSRQQLIAGEVFNQIVTKMPNISEEQKMQIQRIFALDPERAKTMVADLTEAGLTKQEGNVIAKNNYEANWKNYQSSIKRNRSTEIENIDKKIRTLELAREDEISNLRRTIGQAASGVNPRTDLIKDLQKELQILQGGTNKYSTQISELNNQRSDMLYFQNIEAPSEYASSQLGIYSSPLNNLRGSTLIETIKRMERLGYINVNRQDDDAINKGILQVNNAFNRFSGWQTDITADPRLRVAVAEYLGITEEEMQNGMANAPDYAQQQKDFENQNGKTPSLMSVPLFEGDMGGAVQGPVPGGSFSSPKSNDKTTGIPTVLINSQLLDDRSTESAEKVFAKNDFTPETLSTLSEDQFVKQLQGLISSLVEKGMNPAVANQMAMLIGSEAEKIRTSQTIEQEGK